VLHRVKEFTRFRPGDCLQGVLSELERLDRLTDEVFAAAQFLEGCFR